MSKKTRKDQPVIFLTVKQPEAFNPEFFHVTANIGRLVDDRESDDYNRSSGIKEISPEVVNGLHVRDLSLYSQGHKGGENLYGIELCYGGVHRANQRDMERMVKTLKILNKGLAGLAAKFGYTESYADIVMRLASVIGAKRIYWFEKDTNFGAKTGAGGFDQDHVMLPDSSALHRVQNVVDYAIHRYGKRLERFVRNEN